MTDFKLLQQQYMVNTYANRSLTITSGKGLYFYDIEGIEYLDMMTNYGVNILGHSHPVLTERLTQQFSTLVTLHNSFTNDKRAEASINLVKTCGHGLSQVYYSSSGAEAIEAALKFAVLATGKNKFIACKEGYHGKTIGALSATGEEKYRTAFEPLLLNFTHVEYNNASALEKAITSETAAFIIEPIQGEGGIFVPSENYLNDVAEICKKHNVLLIVDEIQTGNGRTGFFLASHANNIEYDIVCLGKGLAAGIPVGATLISKSVSEKISKGSHTSTFGGNPLVCAGILATLELLNESCLEHVGSMGTYFIEKLKAVTSKHISDVRGIGLMIGLEVSCNRDKVLQLLQKEHILAAPAGDKVIRFLPSFLIEKKHIDKTVEVLERVLKQINS